MNELDAIFEYTRHYDAKIARFFCDNAEELHISSCHYCELAYVNVYRVVTGSTATSYQHFDVDHYLPKTKCPIIGLSLFNFIPSCQVCNSRIKSSRTVGTMMGEWIQFSPVGENYGFEDNVKIRLRMHRGLIRLSRRRVSIISISDVRMVSGKKWISFILKSVMNSIRWKRCG